MVEKTWLIVLGAILIFFELLFGALAGFDIAFVGLALVVGGVVHYYSLDWQYAVLAAISVIVIYFSFIKKTMHKKLLLLTQKIGIDSLLGKKGIVVDKITAKKVGKVLIDGEIWQASASTSLPAETEVIVFGLEGSILQVEQITR